MHTQHDSDNTPIFSPAQVKSFLCNQLSRTGLMMIHRRAFATSAEKSPEQKEEEDAHSCFTLLQFPSSLSNMHGSSPPHLVTPPCLPCSKCSTSIHPQPASCDCMQSSSTMLENMYSFDPPYTDLCSHVDHMHKCTLYMHGQYHPNLHLLERTYDRQHSHSCMHVQPHPHSHSHAHTKNQPLDACHYFNGQMQQNLDRPAACIVGATGNGVMQAATSMNMLPLENPQEMDIPCSEFWNVCSIPTQGWVVCNGLADADLSQDHINPMPQYCCIDPHATCPISYALLQSKCGQIAAHAVETQERSCFAAPMEVNVPEHAYDPAGSELVNVQARAHLYMNSAEDQAHQSMASHATTVQNKQAQIIVQSNPPLDLVTHTRKLHDVWWGGATSGKALMEELDKTTQLQCTDCWNLQKQNDQTSYKNAQQKLHIENDDEHCTLQAGLGPGAEPIDDGCFREEFHNMHQNSRNNGPIHKRRRRRYFWKKGSNKGNINASTWDGPSISNVGTMSENHSGGKAADCWGNGNTAAPKQHDSWFKVNNSTDGTICESAHLYNQTWEKNGGLQNKEEFLTMTCPSSHVGWTESRMKTPKLYEEPASENPKKQDSQNIQLNLTSSNAKTKDDAEFPCIQPPVNDKSRNDRDILLPGLANNDSARKVQNTHLGSDMMSIGGEAAAVMPGEDDQARCPPGSKSTWEVHTENLLKDDAHVSRIAHQAMDFLSSSSDDRELEDDVLYESDDACYPMDGEPLEGDAKSRENQAYEFFMQIFEENEALQKRYKDEHGVGEFDCLVCSNIPNKPIKRYNGLVSVVMHAKKILNTKRRHDHRGFARAVCDFMCWDAHGNPLVKHIEHIQPRACILGPESIAEGDGKIIDDSDNELVCGRDSISPEVKEAEAEDVIQGFFRPLEKNVMIVDETMHSEMKESEDEDAMQGSFRHLENKVMMIDKNGIIHGAIQEDETVQEDNLEDELVVTNGEILSSKINKDEYAIQEKFSPMEISIALIEENCIMNGATKEDNSVLQENKEGKLGCGRDLVSSEMKVSEDSTAVPGDNEVERDASGQVSVLKINACHDQEANQEFIRPPEDNITMLEENNNINGAMEDDAELEDNVEQKHMMGGEELSLKINTYQDADQVDITINDTRNGLALNGARICLHSKSCQDEGLSEQPGTTEELEKSRNNCAPESNDSLVQGGSSLCTHGSEGRQDVVNAFREQVLNKRFGLGRNFNKGSNSDVQEVSEECICVRNCSDLGLTEPLCEEEGDDNGRIFPSCQVSAD